jgi:hypothetical protein
MFFTIFVIFILIESAHVWIVGLLIRKQLVHLYSAAKV